jgi:predicted RNA-binding protein with PUA-like domain
MSTWLMKSEPSEYSIDSLARDRQSSWFGVRNYLARNYMRDYMKIGDRILFYHSSCSEVGIAGIARVCSYPHPDETQFIVWDKHYDERSTYEKPIWMYVDVEYVSKLPHILTIRALRSTPWLEKMKILEKWNRLSITPVTHEEWVIIQKMI